MADVPDYLTRIRRLSKKSQLAALTGAELVEKFEQAVVRDSYNPVGNLPYDARFSTEELRAEVRRRADLT